jgi:hypothetical protein
LHDGGPCAASSGAIQRLQRRSSEAAFSRLTSSGAAPPLQRHAIGKVGKPKASNATKIAPNCLLAGPATPDWLPRAQISGRLAATREWLGLALELFLWSEPTLSVDRLLLSPSRQSGDREKEYSLLNLRSRYSSGASHLHRKSTITGGNPSDNTQVRSTTWGTPKAPPAAITHLCNGIGRGEGDGAGGNHDPLCHPAATRPYFRIPLARYGPRTTGGDARSSQRTTFLQIFPPPPAIRRVEFLCCVLCDFSSASLIAGLADRGSRPAASTGGMWHAVQVGEVDPRMGIRGAVAAAHLLAALPSLAWTRGEG